MGLKGCERGLRNRLLHRRGDIRVRPVPSAAIYGRPHYRRLVSPHPPHLHVFSEVFRARVRDNPSEIVALKRVRMDNEREGVSTAVISLHRPPRPSLTLPHAVSHHGAEGNQNPQAAQAQEHH